jgi:hypothetical protein
VYKAMPIYYGIWMARQMGPGRFLPLNLRTDRNLNAYAVRGNDGRIRIAVISKEETSTAPVQLTINVGERSGLAKILRLTGSGLTADDTSISGATVDRSGRLRPCRADQAFVRKGALRLEITAGSAALITL